MQSFIFRSVEGTYSSSRQNIAYVGLKQSRKKSASVAERQKSNLHNTKVWVVFCYIGPASVAQKLNSCPFRFSRSIAVFYFALDDLIWLLLDVAGGASAQWWRIVLSQKLFVHQKRRPLCYNPHANLLCRCDASHESYDDVDLLFFKPSRLIIIARTQTNHNQWTTLECSKTFNCCHSSIIIVHITPIAATSQRHTMCRIRR